MENSDVSKYFCNKFRKYYINCMKIFVFFLKCSICAAVWQRRQVYLHCKTDCYDAIPETGSKILL